MAATVRWLAALSCLALSVVPTLAANPFSVITNNIPKLKIQVEKLDNCPDVNDTPIHLENFLISQVGMNKFVIEGKVNVKTTLQDPTTLAQDIYKCSSSNIHKSSCEYLLTMRKNNICDIMKKQMSGWEEFTKSSNIPHSCPVPPNIYSIDNASVVLDHIRDVPFIQSSWIIRTELYRKKELLLCTEATISTRMVRAG